MVLAKSMVIFLNERSFFTFFAPLTCLDHITLCYFCLAQQDKGSLKKIRALACPLFEISNVKVLTFMTWGYAQPAPFHKQDNRN